MKRHWTSNYTQVKSMEQNGVVPIAISGKPPSWYTGLRCTKLAPKYDFFLAYKQGKIDAAEYTKQFYARVLDTLIPGSTLATLEIMAQGKPFALLCYETPTDFCHRHLVADWLHTCFPNEIDLNEWMP